MTNKHFEMIKPIIAERIYQRSRIIHRKLFYDCLKSFLKTGETYEQASSHINLSVKTLKFHRSRLYKELGIKTNSKLLIYCYDLLLETLGHSLKDYKVDEINGMPKLPIGGK